MTRSVQFLKTSFDEQADKAEAFVNLLEDNKNEFADGTSVITQYAVEISYELAYLRLFGAWESFLEEVFVRYLCGYSRGLDLQEPLLAGQTYSTTLSAAEARLLSGRSYVSWYVPSEIVSRCRRFFSGGNFEYVVSSASQILEDQRCTRHQIAHVQKHATRNFDNMTTRLVGKRFPGSSAGRFLRSQRPGGGRWLFHFSIQLRGLASQLTT